MGRTLAHVTRLLDQAFEAGASCSEDRQCLQEIAARGDQGRRQVRRPVDPFLVATAIDLVHEILGSGEGKGRVR